MNDLREVQSAVVWLCTSILDAVWLLTPADRTNYEFTVYRINHIDQAKGN